MSTATQHATVSQPAPLRWAGGVAVRVAAAVDLWDVLCGLGLVLLAVGLGVWVGAGVALTVVGALLLTLGVAGTVYEQRTLAKAVAARMSARPAQRAA